MGGLGVLLLSIGLSSLMYDIATKYGTSIKMIFSILGIFLIGFSIRKSFHSIIKGVKKTNISGNISKTEINHIIYRERILSKDQKW